MSEKAMRKCPPSAARVRELFYYEPGTGVFTRRVSRPGPRGKLGIINPGGYMQISVDGYRANAHRLAWLYMTAEWPAVDIDHIDGDRTNNRFANLRLATDSQNGANRRMSRNNSSGFKGVTKHKRTGRFYAHIGNMKQKIHIGSFPTAEAAAAAYNEVAKKLKGEYARLNVLPENRNV